MPISSPTYIGEPGTVAVGLRLDGLPIDVAMALSALVYSAINYGCAPVDHPLICDAAAMRMDERRLALVAAIKRHIHCPRPCALPAADHIVLGSLETTEDESVPLMLDLPGATPGVEEVLAKATPRELRLLMLERSPTDNDLEAGHA